MNVFLGFPADSGIDRSNFHSFPIIDSLQTWLRSCCSTHQGAHVRRIGHRITMGPFDGLVYLVGDRKNSIIARVGAEESSNLDSGQTQVAGPYAGASWGMLSKVYVNPSSVYATAANIYHELLHNKFMKLWDVHGTPDGNFTGSSGGAPFWEGGPYPADQNLMCKALSAAAPQFLGGFSW